MANTLKTMLASLGIAMISLPSDIGTAATFAAWQVTDLTFGDTLNVRKYPSSHSQKQAAYPNGTVLQMTGKCTDGINLLDISGQPVRKQKDAVRYRWCQVWHDPARDGNFVAGWIYGKYISPY